MTEIGDWDGDRKNDFAIAAHLANVVQTSPSGNPVVVPEAGSVFVHSGATGTLLHQLDGTSESANFGMGLATIGDLDGDGKRELLIGAPGTDHASRGNAGQVLIVASADRSILWQSDAASVRRGYRLGTCVAEMGDHDGDGIPDLIAGAPGALQDAGTAAVHGRSGQGRTAG
jgi:hypothetical protein